MDSVARSAFRLALVALLLASITLLVSVVLYVRSVDATDKITAETNERRDQACRGAEGLYKTELESLRQTYDLFANPPKGLEELVRDPRLVQQLHEQERDARKDNDRFGQFVTPSCDDPGIGLPEPDPEVPKRPKGLP